LVTGLVCAEGRDPDQVAFDEALVSFFVEAARLLGVPKSVAAIYGVCFANAEPLTFSEIQQRLSISAGSVSQGLRVLREVGAVKASDSPTDRRERFQPDLELRKLVAHWLEERLQKQLEMGGNQLREIARVIPGGRSAAGKELRGRLKALQSWHDKSRALLPLTRAFLKLT